MSSINKKYFLYGVSTLFGKGYEYLVVLFAASLFSKEIYGEFEFYKKTIELLGLLVSFGLPTLIMSYTKNPIIKINFTILSIGLTLVVILTIFPALFLFNLSFLLIPLIFYSCFFYSNSIIQSFNLVYYGSNFSSIYKVLVSFLFNTSVLIMIYFTKEEAFSLIKSTYLILIFTVVFYLFKVYSFYKLGFLRNLKKYVNSFKKLLLGSLSLVINNFVNMAFLYTDIYIIKILAKNSNELIAEYSFSLNITSILLLIPLTISQVDIEEVKKKHSLILEVLRNIKRILILGSFLIIIIYIILINTYYQNYEETFIVFIILVFAKIVQSISIPYGMMLVIKKMFKFNLILNLSILILNILLSYYAFIAYGILGVSISSLIALFVRYIVASKKVNQVL